MLSFWLLIPLLLAFPVHAIIPLPAKLKRTGPSKPTILDPRTFSFTVNFDLDAPRNGSQALVAAGIQRLSSRLSRFTGDGTIPLRLVPDYDEHLADGLRSAHPLEELQVFLYEGSFDDPTLSWQDESYTLDVGDLSEQDSKVSAILKAKGPRGILYGLTTFEQLWCRLYEDALVVYTLMTPLHIEDRPKFPYRGLMLDTSRNFIPIDALHRTLEAMSMVKLNVFHWHVTDAQSWPLMIPGYEMLARRGRYLPHQIYRQKEVKSLYQHARELGISVMMEIDMPGHTSILDRSVPEKMTCINRQPDWSSYAAEPPSGQLLPTSEVVQTFVRPLLHQLLSWVPRPVLSRTREGLYPGAKLLRIFSSIMTFFETPLPLNVDALFSTGGDEINMQCYQTMGLSRDDINNKLGDFFRDAHQAIRDEGFTPVVWDEIALEHGQASRNLGPDVIVQVWRNSSVAVKAVQTGHRIINSPANYVYLDCGMGNWVNNVRNGQSWCDPYKTWQRIYSFDPVADMTPAQSQLVIGSEVLLWGEQADGTNLDTLLWPRSAALAEILWSGQHSSLRPGSLPIPADLDADQSLLQEMQPHPAPRMHDIRHRFLLRGIQAIPLAPYWCAVRQGQCEG